MLVAGCDLGSATGKVVILDGTDIRSWSVVRATTNPEKTGLLALEEAMRKGGLHSTAELSHIVGTGYGRLNVSFISENVSEITCHARGTHWLHPEARTVIDVGGQDCKVVSIDPRGKVTEFVMNDKCAAGTGRFFEAMTRTLDCSLDQFAELSLRSNSPANITKQCSVFAESEVVSLINNGIDPADIAAGLTDSIARRLLAMVHKVGLVSEVVLTGGCANNQGLVRALEGRLGESIVNLPLNPQVVGALGAALFARERHGKAGQS